MFYQFKERPPVWSRDKNIFIFRQKLRKGVYDHILYGEPTGKIVYNNRYIGDTVLDKDHQLYEIFDISMGCEMQHILCSPEDYYITKEDMDKYFLDKLNSGTLEDIWYHKTTDWMDNIDKPIILINTVPIENWMKKVKVHNCTLMTCQEDINQDEEVISFLYCNREVDDHDPDMFTIDIRNTNGQLYAYAEDLYWYFNSIYNFNIGGNVV